MEFNFKDVIAVLARKWFIILLCTILSGGVSFTLSKLLIKQQYQATSLVYVDLLSFGGAKQQLTSGDLQTAQQLVKTYIVILESDTFLEQVAQECKLDYTPADIRSMLKMGSKDDTEIFYISVSHDNKEEVLAISQSITKLSKGAIEDAVTAGSVKVIDKPKVTLSSTTTVVLKNTIIAAIAVMLLISVIVILGDFLDYRIKNEADIENHYNIPLLGSVPSIR